MIGDTPQTRKKPKKKTSGVMNSLGRMTSSAPAQQDQQIAQAFDPFDFSADPILQRIKAISQRGRAEAAAEAERLTQQLAIEYGDEEAGGAAAAANPFSIRKKLEKARVDEPKALLNNLNESNLFYSGHRQTRERDLMTDLLGRETAASNAYRGARGDISASLREALMSADEREAGGSEEAAMRLQERLGDLDVSGGGARGMTNRPLSGLVSGLVNRPIRKKARTPVARRPIGGGY